MKRSFLAIVILMFSLSCTKEKEESAVNNGQNDTISKIESAKDLYKPIDTTCTSKNKTEDYVASLQWHQNKIKNEIAKNSSEKNNKLYEDYYKIREKYTACLSENLGGILEKYVNYYDSESNQLKLPDDIKKLSAELKKADLEFVEVGEGYTEIWSVPDHYFNIFKNKVTPDYNAYIAQLSKESKGLYAADAGLVISWKELGDRTVFWENFLKKYPQSKLISKVNDIYSNYLYDYLFGLDNTPTHEFSNGEIYEENKVEFNRMMSSYPNSNVAKKTKELISLLKSGIPAEEIRKKINIERKY